MEPRPFWESSFENLEAPSPFGQPSTELVSLLPALPKDASVLDLGCGDGRNALLFARKAFRVNAVDISPAAVAKLTALAGREHLPINALVADLREYQIDGLYDLVIAHGCLHLLERKHWRRLIAEAKEHTRAAGYNVIAVFTDTIPPPDDLRPWVLGLFQEGELFTYYSDWTVLTKLSYILDDVHPGGLKHRHPINKIVAQRPTRSRKAQSFE
jgi:tellurite methyltransferase